MTSYSLKTEDRGSYLYAHLTGQDSFEASLSYWNEIADKVKELDAKKLLVHEDLTGEVTEVEIYDIMMDLVNSGLADLKIAFYDENHTDAALNSLGKLVANNRGANVMILNSLKAAQGWIEQDD